MSFFYLNSVRVYVLLFEGRQVQSKAYEVHLMGLRVGSGVCG